MRVFGAECEPERIGKHFLSVEHWKKSDPLLVVAIKALASLVKTKMKFGPKSVRLKICHVMTVRLPLVQNFLVGGALLRRRGNLPSRLRDGGGARSRLRVESA